MAERQGSVDMKAFAVGTAMTEHVRHPAYAGFVSRLGRVALENSAQAAHTYNLMPLAVRRGIFVRANFATAASESVR